MMSRVRGTQPWKLAAVGGAVVVGVVGAWFTWRRLSAASTKPTTKPEDSEPATSSTEAPAAPTAEPTAEPTAAPTVAPTEAPTAAPTVAPTESPTAAPTEPTDALVLDVADGGVDAALSALAQVSGITPGAQVELTGWDFSPKVAEASPLVEQLREQLVAVMEAGAPGTITLRNVQHTGRLLTAQMGDELTQLSVYETIVNERDGLVIGALVAAAPKLTHLTFSHNDSYSKGIIALCSKISKSASLSHVDFSGNSLMSFVGEIVAQMIKSAQALTHLNLSGNQLRSLGVRPLSKALATNSTLQSLDLSDNHIEPAGVEDLKTAVAGNPDSALVEVSLASNSAVSQADIDALNAVLAS